MHEVAPNEVKMKISEHEVLEPNAIRAGMENAIPKDRVILINVDIGWTVARYNKIEDKFVYAMPQTDLYQGKWQDHYFENEWIKESEIKEWKEI